jgi:geranylgeranyl diphosphate synthase type II
MKIGSFCEKRRALIDKALDKVLPRETQIPRGLHKAMRYSVFSGGKRIRPILAIEACLCCGGRITDAINAACAIELVHTFSLIHDDLPAMDDDDYRRGKPACHKKFGEATAILAGDALLTLAFEVLAPGKRPSVEARIIKEFARSIGSLGIAGGQYVDIEGAAKQKNARAIEYINKQKTAALIAASLKMGAMAAGADSKMTGRLGAFGRHIGEAFQIVDDVLDNEGLALVLGRAGAVKRARLLTKKAKETIRPFKNKARALNSIADYLAERRL